MTPISNDEFEDFLRRQTDEHRMYPSDKLWRNIQLTLHGESRWPALTYITIIIIAALVTSTLLVKPEERMKKNAAVYASDYAISTAKAQTAEARSTALTNSPLQHAYTEKITQNTIEAVTQKLYDEQLANTAVQPDFYTNEAAVVINKPASLPLMAAPVTKIPQPIIIADNAAAPANNTAKKATEQTAPARQASMYFSTLGLIHFGGLRMNNDAHLYNTNNEELWRNFALINPSNIISKNLSKLSFQFYITPSVSYRRLTDSKGKSARSYTAIPLSANYKIDINNIVRHTPSAGAEVGFALGYKLSENFTVKGGLQFNVRQYNIEAYSRPAPSPVLPADEISGTQLPDASASAYAISSDYIQNSGKPIILRNRYYEAAAPIGIDWKILTASNGLITLNVAAALQPTYTFDKEPFVITTDYKQYTDGSAIMRNWNINSSMEAYLTYKLGPLRWQVGPQFRYQYLPTYGGGYPIREHLLDYGLKIGFTKSLD